MKYTSHVRLSWGPPNLSAIPGLLVGPELTLCDRPTELKIKLVARPRNHEGRRARVLRPFPFSRGRWPSISANACCVCESLGVPLASGSPFPSTGEETSGPGVDSGITPGNAHASTNGRCCVAETARNPLRLIVRD
jgi:hypothetical protein